MPRQFTLTNRQITWIRLRIDSSSKEVFGSARHRLFPVLRPHDNIHPRENLWQETDGRRDCLFWNKNRTYLKILSKRSAIILPICFDILSCVEGWTNGQLNIAKVIRLANPITPIYMLNSIPISISSKGYKQPLKVSDGGKIYLFHTYLHFQAVHLKRGHLKKRQ